MQKSSGQTTSAPELAILIPKQLRMEWTDVLALDKRLSPTAFRVGCVIGSHFSRHRGNAFISQERIAQILDISKRTVWSAITELEVRGYLIVQRRELGHRVSDGRRVCGGKGVANTYLPAFDREQVVATTAGAKLAERCDHVWADLALRSQKAAPMVASDCEPTLVTSPLEKNSFTTTTSSESNLDAPLRELRHSLGEKHFDAWFREVVVVGIDAECLFLWVPTDFTARWIDQKFSSQILACWQKQDARVQRVIISSGPREAV
jgi:biotin operon repressor